jgi:hypothetical protein
MDEDELFSVRNENPASSESNAIHIADVEEIRRFVQKAEDPYGLMRQKKN